MSLFWAPGLECTTRGTTDTICSPSLFFRNRNISDLLEARVEDDEEYRANAALRTPAARGRERTPIVHARD